MKMVNVAKILLCMIAGAVIATFVCLKYIEERDDESNGNVFEVVARAYNPVCYSFDKRDYVHTASDHAVFRAVKRLKVSERPEEERMLIYTAILLGNPRRDAGDIALETVVSENETAQFRVKLVEFWKSRITTLLEVEHCLGWSGKRLFDGIALLASKDQEDYIECWGKIGLCFTEQASVITPERSKQLMDELEMVFSKQP